MTKEQQIEEMAREIQKAGVALDGTDFAYGLVDRDDHFHRLAKKLVDTGYRKEDEVRKETAREIFAKIFSIAREQGNAGHIVNWVAICAQVAKDYGVEVDDGDAR